MPTTATKLPLEIEIKLVNGKDVIPTLPDDMRVGQSVHYSSKAGDFEIEFPPSGGVTPFSAGDASFTVQGTRAEGSPILVLQNAGEFTCRCSLKLPNGDRLGWPMAGDQSGGNHVVK
jgi:hypothetical protein